MYSLEFILPGTPKAPNKLLGHSFWTKHKNSEQWRVAVGLTVLRRGPEKPLERVKIELERRAPRTLDYDGLVASFKPVVDGLVEHQILKNDTWPITGPWSVNQVYAPRGKEHIWVRVTEVEKNNDRP